MVTVVVGGQYGSEGKGKVACHLALEQQAIAAIRVGGPNAGHTVRMQDGVGTVLRQLPSPCVLPGVSACLAAGSYINIDILLEEIERVNTHSDDPIRVFIDPNAIIIDPVDLDLETRLKQDVGSTGSGTGYATIKRIQRIRRDTTAATNARLNDHPNITVTNVHNLVADWEFSDQTVILEGTQGFGLSILHADCYPFTTSRDTTVMACLSDAGIPLNWVGPIAMVVRARSIRVGGNSGPMAGEVDWKTVAAESGADRDLTELTSVTKKVRRVGDFDFEVVRRAISYNGPDMIFMNHLDQIDDQCSGVTHWENMTDKAREYVAAIEKGIGSLINYVGTGPDVFVEVNEGI